MDKLEITRMKEFGMSYGEISKATGICTSTIKSICRRAAEGQCKCMECGKKLNFTNGKKKKRFCDDNCRMRYWNHHRKPPVEHECPVCHRTFNCYDCQHAKYCSRSCYLTARRTNDER